MKKIIIESSSEICIQDIPKGTPIFAKKDGCLCGMVVKEDDGWILRIGSIGYGSNGHHKTIEECLSSCAKYGYTFYIDITI